MSAREEKVASELWREPSPDLGAGAARRRVVERAWSAYGTGLGGARLDSGGGLSRAQADCFGGGGVTALRLGPVVLGAVEPCTQRKELDRIAAAGM